MTKQFLDTIFYKIYYPGWGVLNKKIIFPNYLDTAKSADGFRSELVALSSSKIIVKLHINNIAH